MHTRARTLPPFATPHSFPRCGCRPSVARVTCDLCRRTHPIWNYSSVEWPDIVGGATDKPSVVNSPSLPPTPTHAEASKPPAPVAPAEVPPAEQAKAAAAALGSAPRYGIAGTVSKRAARFQATALFISPPLPQRLLIVLCCPGTRLPGSVSSLPLGAVASLAGGFPFRRPRDARRALVRQAGRPARATSEPGRAKVQPTDPNPHHACLPLTLACTPVWCWLHGSLRAGVIGNEREASTSRGC